MVHGCMLAEPCLHVICGLVHTSQDTLQEWGSAGLEGQYSLIQGFGVRLREGYQLEQG